MSTKFKNRLLMLLGLAGFLVTPSLSEAWCGTNCEDRSHNYTETRNSRSFNRQGSHNTRDLANSNLGYIDNRATFGNVTQMGVSNSPVSQIYSPVINFGDTQNGTGQ